MKAISETEWLMEPSWLSKIVGVVQAAEKGEGLSLEALVKQYDKDLAGSYEAVVSGDTAIIPLKGPIFRNANMMTTYCGATALGTIVNDFNAAVTNPEVSRIIIEMDTPGGQVTGISDFSKQVRAAVDSGMEVVAYVEGMGCSAGYWIASACSKIYVSDTAVLGSIGVMATYSGDNAEDGSITFISSNAPMKNPSPSSKEGAEAVQARVDAMETVFINTVAKYRGVSRDTVVSRFGRGGVFVGAESVEAGLADGISTIDELLDRNVTIDNKNLNGGTVMEYSQEQLDAAVDAARTEEKATASSAVAAETARVVSIIGLCAKAKVADDVMLGAIENGSDVGSAAIAILEAQAVAPVAAPVAPVAAPVAQVEEKGTVLQDMVNESLDANAVSGDGNTQVTPEQEAQQLGKAAYASAIKEQ